MCEAKPAMRTKGKFGRLAAELHHQRLGTDHHTDTTTSPSVPNPCEIDEPVVPIGGGALVVTGRGHISLEPQVIGFALWRPERLSTLHVAPGGPRGDPGVNPWGNPLPDAPRATQNTIKEAV